MGIQGLIPFLQKTSRPVNVSQYSGCTVAVDAYCWLHKGAFSCSDKLARGDKTDMYVTYCMKYVNMLLSHNIKPILVFDGRHLPAKAETEQKRRQNREINRRRAAELLRQDKPSEARTYLQRCVDVTHEMAVELMQECRKRNVDCITAPYEADSQLAFLNINNFAHIVITEDSDLLLFGCTKVLFKLDLNGNGLLVEQERLHLSMGVAPGCFSLDKFRHMCILSGCDYLPSLPKIGLAKALRFVKSTVDPDIHRALSRLGGHLNMSISVPVEYRDKFLEAEAMFRHQPVFDPVSRKIVPLTPLPPGAPPLPLLTHEPLSPDQQLQLALGNLHPFTLKPVADWSPASRTPSGGKSGGWSAPSVAPHKSIWTGEYKPRALVIERPDPCKVERPSTVGKVMERSPPIPVKRSLKDTEEEMDAIRKQFSSPPVQPQKKQRVTDDEVEDLLDLLEKPDKTPPKPTTDSQIIEISESPKKHQPNPFSKSTPDSTGSKFSGLSKLAQFRKTNVSSTNIVQSRYFGSEKNKSSSQSEEKPNVQSLKDVSNVFNTNSSKDDQTADEKTCSVHPPDDPSDNVTNTAHNLSQEKENCSEEQSKSKGGTFKWKPSLAEMFGYKGKGGTSPAVRSSFFAQSSPSVAENNVNTPPTGEKGLRRNPFAKVTKVEERLSNKCPEDSSSSNSQPSSSTPSTSESQESDLSVESPPPAKLTPRPSIKVGLSKKQSTPCQRSLLSMFAFTPKAKLQR